MDATVATGAHVSVAAQGMVDNGPDDADAADDAMDTSTPAPAVSLTATAATALTLTQQVPIATLTGHFDRLSRLVWHPHGGFLVSGRSVSSAILQAACLSCLFFTFSSCFFA